VNILVGIISRPNSITSQIPPCTPELWPLNCPTLGFPLSKSKSCCPVLSNLVNMLVGIISRPNHISCQIPAGTPKLWPFNCPNIGFPLSKAESFHPVFIKLGAYVGGHNISTKFYNLPNPPCTPKLWPLNCSKTELMVFAVLFEYPAHKNVVITIKLTTNTTGVFYVSLARFL